MIIIPDVHGRKFWKEAVAQARPSETVVFLGDYMEPYGRREGILFNEAYENFREILAYAETHRDTCRLLLGNHDFSCMFNTQCMASRHDFYNELRNMRLYAEHYDLFSLAHAFTPGDGRLTLLSHAGIHRQWFEASPFCPATGEHGEADIPRLLNDIFLPLGRRLLQRKIGEKEGRSLSGIGGTENDDDDILRLSRPCLSSLLECSYFRGGSYCQIYGSCLWADIAEWIDKPKKGAYGCRQVFGHSQCNRPIIEADFAMLDCRRAFRLDEATGCISPL